ncbi:MAG: AAA family ATPase [Bacteroidaceae bacterium]|nr:AAA family ATPase [Bacteroidaceae bacterium]
MVWGNNIVDFLTKLTKRPKGTVLARKFKEVTQSDRHMTVMWYCQEDQIVLVGLEHHQQTKEYLADEEPFAGTPPMYFSESGHYYSPVHQLKKLRNEVSKTLQEQRLLTNAIWIVYVTNNRLINIDAMKDDVWLPDRVIVFDRQEDLSPKFCPESAYQVKVGLEAFRYAKEHTTWDGTEDPDETYDDVEEEDELDDIIDTKYPFGKPSSSDDEAPRRRKASTYVPKLEDGMRAEVYPCLENPEAMFEDIIGCQEIREQIRQLTTLHSYNLRMREFNPKAQPHEMSLHAIFHGSPGTGKTTLCRLYASLLFQAGALTHGHVVVASRSTFLGTNFGDEEKAVHAVLKAAKGGVLMIDEAYLLNPPHPNDPGKHVLQLMMPMLADEKERDIAIVLCGYTEPMEKLLSLNEGLASRFPNRFKFPDFTVPQLLDISKLRIKKFNYHFTPKAWKLYKEMVTQVYDHRDKKKWGNAREMGQLLDKIYIHHAKRCMSTSDPKKMFAITVADIKPVEGSLTFSPQHHIGFR